MRSFYWDIFTLPYAYDISRKEEFELRGTYHAANPIVNDRQAGYFPFKRIATPTLTTFVPPPDFVFQNAPLHTPVAHTNNLDIIKEP